MYVYMKCIYFISIVGSITCSAGLPLTPLHAIGFPGATSAFQVARTCRSALQSLVQNFTEGADEDAQAAFLCGDGGECIIR